MEAKLEQQLAGIVHNPLFQVFIDVRKAYNSLGRGRCMKILRGYGLGPRLQQLLQRYWYGQRVVPNSGKYYGCPFSTGRGMTQGDPLYLKMFNIIMDALVRTNIQEMCTPGVSTWVQMVSGGTQHLLLRRLLTDIREISDLGIGSTADHGKYVL